MRDKATVLGGWRRPSPGGRRRAGVSRLARGSRRSAVRVDADLLARLDERNDSPRETPCRVQHRTPGPTSQRERHHEIDGGISSIEEDVEAVVHDVIAAGARALDAISVQEHSESARERHVPVLIRHVTAVRLEPADVRQCGAAVREVRAADRAALEPATTAEHGVRPTKRDELRHEGAELAVDRIPVQP